MAIHSNIFAWRIPWTEKPGGLQSMGSQRDRHKHTRGGYLGKCRLGEKDPLYYLEVLRHHIHCLLLISSEKKKKNHDSIQ